MRTMTISDIGELFDLVDDISRLYLMKNSSVKPRNFASRCSTVVYQVPEYGIHQSAPRTRKEILRLFKRRVNVQPPAWLMSLAYKTPPGAKFSRLGFRMWKYTTHVALLQTSKYGACLNEHTVFAKIGDEYISGYTYYNLPDDIGVKYGYRNGYQLYNIVYLTQDGRIGFGHPGDTKVEIAYVALTKAVPNERPTGFVVPPVGEDASAPELFMAGKLRFVEKRDMPGWPTENGARTTSLRLRSNTYSDMVLRTKYGSIGISVRSGISDSMLDDANLVLEGLDCTTVYTKDYVLVDADGVRVKFSPHYKVYVGRYRDLLSYIARYLEDNTSPAMEIEVETADEKYTVKISGRRVERLRIQKAIAKTAAALILGGSDYLQRIREYVKMPPQYRALARRGVRIGPYTVPVEIQGEKIYLVIGDRKIRVGKSYLRQAAYNGYSKNLVSVYDIGLSIAEYLDLARRAKLWKYDPEERARKTLNLFVKSVPWVEIQDGYIVVTSVSGRKWEVDPRTGDVTRNGRHICIVDVNSDVPLADRVLGRVLALRNDIRTAKDVFTIQHSIEGEWR